MAYVTIKNKSVIISSNTKFKSAATSSNLPPVAKGNPAIIKKFLKGMRYPSLKRGLIAAANSNDAPAPVIGVLNRFADKEYYSDTDVSKELWRIQ